LARITLTSGSEEFSGSDSDKDAKFGPGIKDNESIARMSKSGDPVDKQLFNLVELQ